MARKCVRGGFLRGVNLFPKKNGETKIAAKFDAFIREVNVWHIFDHNSADCSMNAVLSTNRRARTFGRGTVRRKKNVSFG